MSLASEIGLFEGIPSKTNLLNLWILRVSSKSKNVYVSFKEGTKTLILNKIIYKAKWLFNTNVKVQKYILHFLWYSASLRAIYNASWRRHWFFIFFFIYVFFIIVVIDKQSFLYFIIFLFNHLMSSFDYWELLIFEIFS